MRFWDSSALVPLVVKEASTQTARRLLDEDASVTVWWATLVECASAISRRERLGASQISIAEVSHDLSALAAGWVEIPATERLRGLALRVIRTHDLHAADALQLAAAVVASEERPATLDLVTLDDRLALAARREGFTVLPG